MSVEFTVADLLTVAGCGGTTLVFLQFIVKPLLAALEKRQVIWLGTWRDFIVNLSAFVVAIGAAFAAQAVAGITYASALQAVLTGLGGGATAIGAYEGLKNALQGTRQRPRCPQCGR